MGESAVGINLDRWPMPAVSFREARLLAAMNYRFAKITGSRFYGSRYLRHQERHCLIFRSRMARLVKIGINLLGLHSDGRSG